ncbi:MAG: hypothetical protein JSS24_12275 [Proteobacteria bacterium]|nr:hypothetical protein [Pseudomonadota bacterium]
MNTAADTPNLTPPRRRGGLGLVAGIAILLVVSLTLWSWLALAWSYSEGERAGIVLKFSKRGWLCKTYEGELAQYVVAGVAPQIWEFSVRSAAVANQLGRSVGRQVQLHYSEHRGLPTDCFGDTRYFVDRVTLVDDLSLPAVKSKP